MENSCLNRAEFEMANVDDHDGVRTEIKVYRRRYVILAIFALLSASNSLQWIEYSIIANTVVQFYSIEYIMVDFTSMIYMASYILFIVPASWYLDKYGLRASILLGALGNSLGALLKIFSAHPDKFWLSFIGQSIAGSSQVFTLGVPSRLAATWFQTEHVATACAVGVFGNQLGIAIGFIIPPLIVPTTGVDQIASGLMTLFIVSASANLVVFVLVILFFQEKPKRPPSIAQSLLVGRKESYTETLKNLMTNLNYSLLFVTYGLNTGVFYGISTLLTQIISQYFSDSEKLSGIIGLILVLSGMFGSIICGVILDRLRCYKNFTLVIYLFSAACMLLFTFSLFLSQQWIIFIITAALGFFMTGYLPIGFEFAAELTYPIPESTTAGLLNASAQVFGIITTLLMGQIIHKWGAFLCNIIGSCSLAFGLILTAFIKNDLKRQEVQMSKHCR